jgi:phosphoserine/homoserine phosphotransferase
MLNLRDIWLLRRSRPPAGGASSTERWAESPTPGEAARRALAIAARVANRLALFHAIAIIGHIDPRRLARERGAQNAIQGALMELACLDLEGVLVPEIWINVAERTGVEALRLTTRDIPDYDQLMRQRLALLDQHGLKLSDIQRVIARMGPLEGARECLDWLRERFQVVILSDTYYEFALPLMRQLGWPTLFCHRLEVVDDRVVNYVLRQTDGKRAAVRAFHALNFRVIAAGDSYNDTAMLAEAEAGILFRPPRNVIEEFPQFPVARTFEELREAFRAASVRSL